MSIRLTQQTARADERRVAQRLTAAQVPWIVTVQPLVGIAGTLLDISATGILLDSRARLMPHRRNVIVIGTDDQQKERVEATVVRTQLVSIAPDGEPLYRTALSFVKGFSPKLQEKVAAALSVGGAQAVDQPSRSEPAAAVGPQLEGPFAALWATEWESRATEAWQVSDAGCIVRPSGDVVVGQWASVRIFFSPTRQLLLAGRVASVDAAGGATMRFEQLTADDRRALGVELTAPVGLRRRATTAGSQNNALPGTSPVVAAAQRVPGYGGVSLHTNAW